MAQTAPVPISDTLYEVWLAAPAVHADPLAVHGLQFGLDREEEHLDVGQDISAVASAGAGNATGRGRRQISGVQQAGARHSPNMAQQGGYPALVSVPTRGTRLFRMQIIKADQALLGVDSGSVAKSALVILSQRHSVVVIIEQ
jgi:hypothetical protein